MKKALVAVAVGLAAVAVGVVPASATTTAVYSATPSTLPANMPSEGPEAYAFNQIGDEVALAGSARNLNVVTVTMSSWACQNGAWNTNDCGTTAGSTYKVPITLNLYNASSAQQDGTVRPGTLFASVTKTFNIPYRPSANPAHCTAANGKLGEWWNKADGKCYNGKAANVSWDFTSLGLTLPNDLVVGISYNTTHYGYNPVGESAACYGTSAGCAYDALNVGLNPDVRIGSKPYPGTVFQDTNNAGELCDSTPATGVFNLDSPTNACWGGYNPAIRITAH